jgi:transposase
VAEIASEILRTKERIAALDGRLEKPTKSNPKGPIVRSLPGMGRTLTAEFLAEAGDLERFGTADGLAAAAGITPVLRSSGSVSRWRRAKKGNRVLKRVFYQSAHCAILHHDTSKVFYRRKRSEGKRHNQAMIALARRRVNVLWRCCATGSTTRSRPKRLDFRHQDAFDEVHCPPCT